MTTGPQEVIVGRQHLRVSNLAKVLYPASGTTKAQLIDYYVRIAHVLLPHLRNRPVTLRRFPEGVTGEAFFEKNCPSHRPSWVRTVPIWSERRRIHTNFCLLNDLPSLVWAANLAAIELHPSLSVAKDLDRPTTLVFDLDPGEPADIATCARLARVMHRYLTTLHLTAFPKTSGSKGLQVYVPLNTRVTYDETKRFARSMAELLERDSPELVVSQMRKELRRGKVFIDWSQNDPHKTTVSVYSLRARERPTISTPLTWDEVDLFARQGRSALPLFEPAAVLQRIEKLGDLFHPVLTMKQRLPSL